MSLIDKYSKRIEEAKELVSNLKNRKKINEEDGLVVAGAASVDYLTRELAKPVSLIITGNVDKDMLQLELQKSGFYKDVVMENPDGTLTVISKNSQAARKAIRKLGLSVAIPTPESKD